MTENQTIPRKPEELAYLAGLFDGEGGIHVRRLEWKRVGPNFSASLFRFHVYLSMCDPEAVLWMHETFGGNIQKIHAQKAEWRDSYRWTIGMDKAIAILKQIYPYMKVKKEPVALLFKFREAMKNARYEKDAHRIQLLDELMAKIQSYNRKGKAAARRLRGSVETERSASGDGVKFQSELAGDCKNVALVA